MRLAIIYFLPLVVLLTLLPPTSTLFPYTTLFRSHPRITPPHPASTAAPAGTPPPRAAAINATGTSKDRKSTRLNSSHSQISYAVFCLKKKTIIHNLLWRYTSSIHVTREIAETVSP